MGETNFPNPHDRDIAALESDLAANNLALSKVSDSMTYVVNGDKSIEAVSIPAGAYVRLVNSTITGRSDGIYTAKKAIPVAPTVLDSTYFSESAPIVGGVGNALNDKITTQVQWKEESSYPNAYANATTELMLVALYNNGNVDLALQLIIPKSLITNTWRVWENGDSYNGISFHHLQAKVNTIYATDIGVYIGANSVSGAIYKWFSR